MEFGHFLAGSFGERPGQMLLFSSVERSSGTFTRDAISQIGSSANFVVWLRWVQHDAPAEQGEAGAAVHLALDHLDLVDGALDPPRPAAGGEPVDARFLVVPYPRGHRPQPGPSVDCPLGPPLFAPVAPR